MRFHLLGLLLLAGTAAPALAQDMDRLERRVDRLERDVEQVQRRVSGDFVQPEIRPQTGADPIGGIPASSAVADLTARLDALEAQLARVTGQVEENSFSIRQYDDVINQFRHEVDDRLKAIEEANAPAPESVRPEPQAEPAVEAENSASIEQPDTGDAAEDAYLVGYRLWEAGRFAEAQRALEAMAKKYPRHRRASYARNLAGRAALDAGQPGTAAKLLLANYQADKDGERAQDSLYFLGSALVALKKPADACKVYQELENVYGDGMRDWVRQRLPKARTDAKCS